MIGETYPRSRCGLLTYSAGRRDAPRKPGSHLLWAALGGIAAKAGGGLREVFAECNDPVRAAWRKGDPATRRRGT